MKINDIVLENKANMSADDLEKAIRDAAKKYGINPDIAVRVWQSEGGAAYQSNLVPQKGSKTKTLNGKESSFGPFQLYTGGGLGNDYEKKYGVKPIIYTGRKFYTKYLKDEFSDCPLWIASYSNENSINGIEWDLHQFTEKVIVKGVPEKVDGNNFKGDFVKLKNDYCIK